MTKKTQKKTRKSTKKTRTTKRKQPSTSTENNPRKRTRRHDAVEIVYVKTPITNDQKTKKWILKTSGTHNSLYYVRGGNGIEGFLWCVVSKKKKQLFKDAHVYESIPNAVKERELFIANMLNKKLV